MRIQKYLSEIGLLSRREAEKYLLLGLIKVNGKVIDKLGTTIDPEKDKIEVDLQNSKAEKKSSFAVYKPIGIVVSESESEGKTIKKAFPKLSHLSPIGRLDKQSEGLLILSNDGVIAKNITGKDHLIEKEYEVTVREDVVPAMIEKFKSGIVIDKQKTLPAKAEKIDRHTFSICLKEGRKHQIRRMCDAVHLTVENLKRIRIGKITLGSLGPGNARALSKEEIDSLKTIKN